MNERPAPDFGRITREFLTTPAAVRVLVRGRALRRPGVLVQTAAFAHIRVSPGCRGYTTLSSGRAGCGCCGWGMSARMGDAGTTGSARFSQAALARVGQAIALAVAELVHALFEAVLP